MTQGMREKGTEPHVHREERKGSLAGDRGLGMVSLERQVRRWVCYYIVSELRMHFTYLNVERQSKEE